MSNPLSNVNINSQQHSKDSDPVSAAHKTKKGKRGKKCAASSATPTLSQEEERKINGALDAQPEVCKEGFHAQMMSEDTKATPQALHNLREENKENYGQSHSRQKVLKNYMLNPKAKTFVFNPNAKAFTSKAEDSKKSMPSSSKKKFSLNINADTFTPLSEDLEKSMPSPSTEKFNFNIDAEIFIPRCIAQDVADPVLSQLPHLKNQNLATVMPLMMKDMDQARARAMLCHDVSYLHTEASYYIEYGSLTHGSNRLAPFTDPASRSEREPSTPPPVLCYPEDFHPIYDPLQQLTQPHLNNPGLIAAMPLMMTSTTPHIESLIPRTDLITPYDIPTESAIQDPQFCRAEFMRQPASAAAFAFHSFYPVQLHSCTTTNQEGDEIVKEDVVHNIKEKELAEDEALNLCNEFKVECAKSKTLQEGKENLLEEDVVHDLKTTDELFHLLNIKEKELSQLEIAEAEAWNLCNEFKVECAKLETSQETNEIMDEKLLNLIQRRIALTLKKNLKEKELSQLRQQVSEESCNFYYEAL